MLLRIIGLCCRSPETINGFSVTPSVNGSIKALVKHEHFERHTRLACTLFDLRFLAGSDSVIELDLAIHHPRNDLISQDRQSLSSVVDEVFLGLCLRGGKYDCARQRLRGSDELVGTIHLGELV